MAKLTAAGRKSIPTDEFAGPDRSFPIEDNNHAEAAIEDTPKAEAAGSIDAEEADTIKKRAEAKLDKHPTRVAIRKASDRVRSRSL